MRHFQRVIPACVIAVLALLLGPGWVSAQGEFAAAERGPRFMQPAVGTGVPEEVDVTRLAMLRRRVSLNQEGATVKQLLQEITRQSGIRFAYQADLFPVDRVVGLRADSITIAAALTEILVGTGIDVLLKSSRQAVLLRRGALPQNGNVMGRVTDAKTGEGLVGAEVLLEGAGRRTATNADGQYRLADIAPGDYTLTVRRIGYRRQSRRVTIVDGQDVTVDVALEAVPTQLDEVVTTVTGEQRLRELGHVVGRINADSLVKEAPVSSLSELLNGRVPGLQVFTHQGTVGGAVELQVRGPNSALLGTEPIVIIDGIRYTSGTNWQQLGLFGVEPTTRLNDLNPNDIESIEVVKGPSAATLYGTDAANGVLVITTKRGRPGPARWNAYAKGTTTAIPSFRYPDIYWGWPGAFGGRLSCSLKIQEQGFCVQDSVTALPNPLNDPALTIFGSKPRWEYGANVSGGRQDLQYYFSGDFERATGPLRMPRVFSDSLARLRGVAGLPDDQLEPNAFTKGNLRASVTARLAQEAELRVNAGYSRSATRTIVLSASPANPYVSGTRATRPDSPYGTSRSSPASVFSQTSNERVDRFVGSATGEWRPVAWLSARGTGGLDLTSTARASLARRGETPSGDYPTGAVGDDRIRQVSTTAELGLTAMARRGRITSRTSVGAQYVRTLLDGLTGSGVDLPPGAESIGEAATRSSSQVYSEAVTLGSYLEQTFGLNDRLFLTGALRVDGASTFGRDYDATVYPKASASWLVSEEPFLPRLPGLDELRLRYAFGASGQQPRPEWARPGFVVGRAVLGGTTTTAVEVNSLGNPALRPERVREHEFGFDATALAGRVSLGLTWYHRRTVDQIFVTSLTPALGSIHTNLGLTSGRGFEAQLTARLLESRVMNWHVSLQHAVHRTTLVHLGDAQPRYDNQGSYLEGYSLGARFMAPIAGYADANGNGIIERLEVEMGDTAVYVGESTPPRSQTLTTTVGLFHQRLRLSALLERRSGFTQVNELQRSQCQSSGTCRAAVDPSTPLAKQAEVAALGRFAKLRQGFTEFTFVERGDFTRLREVSAALDLPLSFARALRLRSATVSVAARNLALWAPFSGPDPESATVRGLQGGIANGIPQGRSWMLRLDLGL